MFCLSLSSMGVLPEGWPVTASIQILRQSQALLSVLGCSLFTVIWSLSPTSACSKLICKLTKTAEQNKDDCCQLQSRRMAVGSVCRTHWGSAWIFYSDFLNLSQNAQHWNVGTKLPYIVFINNSSKKASVCLLRRMNTPLHLPQLESSSLGNTTQWSEFDDQVVFLYAKHLNVTFPYNGNYNETVISRYKAVFWW